MTPTPELPKSTRLLHRARSNRNKIPDSVLVRLRIMIHMRHEQPSLWKTFFVEEVAELWEPWMRAVDELLEDDELLGAVFEAQGQRHSQSRIRGRHQTPAEVVVQMLIPEACSEFGVTRRWNGKCAPTWCTGASAESEWRGCGMPRR